MIASFQSDSFMKRASTDDADAYGANSASADDAGAHSSRDDDPTARSFAPASARKKVKPRIRGAGSPHEVRHALSFRGGSIAWAILHGHKIIENRPFRLPDDGWVAVHVGKGRLSPADCASYRARCGAPAGMPSERELAELWQGKIVGAIAVREARRPANCGESVWASGPVCNVIGAVHRYARPVDVPKGALSLWPIGDAARARIAAQQPDDPAVLPNDLAALPPYEPIVGPIRAKPADPDDAGSGA